MKRCTAVFPQGRCTGTRLAGREHCRKCTDARAVVVVIPPHQARAAHEKRSADEGVGVLRDPIYAERVKSWLGDPKALLDWRRTMARCQAMADMLEDRVRRGGEHGVTPPALLAAVTELRQLHLAIGKLEGALDTSTHVHVSILNGFILNAINVLTEFVPPERVGAALDKLRALLAHALPAHAAAMGAETNGGTPDDGAGD